MVSGLFFVLPVAIAPVQLQGFEESFRLTGECHLAWALALLTAWPLPFAPLLLAFAPFTLPELFPAAAAVAMPDAAAFMPVVALPLLPRPSFELP
jgi:hypothetical protein